MYPAINGKAVYRLVQVSDVHAPFHHVRGVQAFRNFMADVQPDLLTLQGDIWDAAALCRYPVQHRREDRSKDLGQEMEVSQPFLSEWIKNAGETVYLAGNHDVDRAQRVLANEARGLAWDVNTMWHLMEHYRYPAVKFFQPPKKEGAGHRENLLWVGNGDGQVGVQHGVIWPMHAAYQLITKEYPGENVAQAHTHRPQLYYWKGVYGLVGGHMLDQNQTHYMPNNAWTMAFTVVEFYADGECSQPTIVRMQERDGSFSYGGKVYTAEGVMK
jgi:predicted phosphodiesterase